MATKANEEVSSVLAHHLVSSHYAQIPAAAVEQAKKSILDTIGVSLAATTLAPECKKLIEMVKESGGKKESTILGFGWRVPVGSAAFANGGLSHGLDYEDIHHQSVSHPSGVVVPAALAMAERIGGISGKDFITAVALGQDLIIRLTGAPYEQDHNWLPFPVFGVFGAAAACGRLLGLNAEGMNSAIGIALCYSAGVRIISRGAGTGLRAIYNAFPSEGGVRAALMAQKGIAGPEKSLEGERGFFSAYFQSEYDRDKITIGLGREFRGAEIGYKPWPSCGNTHAAVDATLSLVHEHTLEPANVDRIIVSVSSSARGICEPLDVKRRPSIAMEAKFSLPFTVAVAASRQRVTLNDFTDEGLHNTGVLQMAQRVTPRIDEKLSALPGITAAIVEIMTRDGRHYSRRVDFPYGHPTNPMSLEDIIAKFRECAAFSVHPLSHPRIERTIDLITHLDQVDDVSQILRPRG